MSKTNIFDIFCVIDSNAKIKFQYISPKSAMGEKDMMELLSQIPSFAFPGWPKSSNSTALQAFSFALQAQDGKRRFGYCHHYYINNQDLECLCLLSEFPWLSLLSSILDTLHKRRAIVAHNSALQEKTVKIFLDKMLSYPFPLPGEKFEIICAPVLDHSVTLNETCQKYLHEMEEEGYFFTRPKDDDNNLVSEDNIKILFKKLDLLQIIHLFVAVMEEQHLVFCASDIQSVSSIIHGLLSLIYPFNWAHILIPILPAKLISYVCAPMPFIVGIHTSMLREVKSLPTENLIIVNLDTKEISGLQINPDYFNPLKITATKNFVLPNAIKLHNQLKSANGQTDKIMNAFLDFFVAIFGEYRLYMRVKIRQNNQLEFDEEAFLDSHNQETRDFLIKLTQSQLYQQFIAERKHLVKTSALPSGRFEHACCKVVPFAYGIGMIPSQAKKSNNLSLANAKYMMGNLLQKSADLLNKAKNQSSDLVKKMNGLAVGSSPNKQPQQTHQSQPTTPSSAASTTKKLPPVPQTNNTATPAKTPQSDALPPKPQKKQTEEDFLDFSAPSSTNSSAFSTPKVQSQVSLQRNNILDDMFGGIPGQHVENENLLQVPTVENGLRPISNSESSMTLIDFLGYQQQQQQTQPQELNLDIAGATHLTDLGFDDNFDDSFVDTTPVKSSTPSVTSTPSQQQKFNLDDLF